MNTKRKSNSQLGFALLILPALFSACTNSENKSPDDHKKHGEIIYTCPMHPEVESNEPGNCPKCNMKLVLKVNEAAEQIISPDKQVLSRQSTVKPETKNGGQIIKTQGYIDFDKTRSKSISIRSGGRIEKLYVKYDLQFVKKGDKILELYSPELNTFQEEHLFLLRSNSEKTLIEQSRQKLSLLGITSTQISQLEKNGTFTQTIAVYSPADGFVQLNSEMNDNSSAEASQQTPMNMSMTSKSNAAKTYSPSGSQIREGMYVNKGEMLFSINDLQEVWAIVSVNPKFQPAISKNNPVKIISEFFPDRQLIGKIVLTEQTFEDDKQRFLRVRISLPNKNGELKIKSLVMAEIPLGADQNFQVPASAVYHTGLNSFVWVKTGTTQSGTGIFQLRKVKAGSALNGITTIISGLTANAEIAEQAGYLTDSETFLNDK